jgi:hypothetical protein
MRRYTPRPTRPEIRAAKFATTMALVRQGYYDNDRMDRVIAEAMELIDPPKWKCCRGCSWPLGTRPSGLFPRAFCTKACANALVRRKRDVDRAPSPSSSGG